VGVCEGPDACSDLGASRPQGIIACLARASATTPVATTGTASWRGAGASTGTRYVVLHCDMTATLGVTLTEPCYYRARGTSFTNEGLIQRQHEGTCFAARGRCVQCAQHNHLLLDPRCQSLHTKAMRRMTARHPTCPPTPTLRCDAALTRQCVALVLHFVVAATAHWHNESMLLVTPPAYASCQCAASGNVWTLGLSGRVRAWQT
jgi:hypothetical protein